MYSKNLNEINKFGLEIQKAKLDAASKKGRKNEPFAQGIDKWGASIDRVVQHNMSNGHKEKPAESFMKGMASGISGSLRSQDNEEFEKVYDYFNSNLKNIEQTNAYNESKQKKMDELSPYISTGLELMNSGLPHETVMPELKNIFEKAQMNNPDLKGNVVGYIPNSPFVTVRDENGNMKTISMASFIDPEDYKEIVKNNLDRQKLKLETDPNSFKNKKAAAYIQQVQDLNDPELQGRREAEKQKAKQNVKRIHEIDEKVHKMDRLYVDNTELIKILNTSPQAGSSTFKELVRYFKEKTGQTLDRDKIRVLVASAYSKAEEMLGKGTRSDTDMETFAKTLPGLDKDPKAMVELLEAQQRQLKKEREAGRLHLKNFAKDPLANLTDSTDYSAGMYDEADPGTGITPEKTLPLTPEQQQAVGKSPMVAQQQKPKMVRMTAPDGTAILIPEANVGAAKDQGARLAE